MFDTSVPVLYFSKNAVQLANVITSGNPHVAGKKSFPWARTQTLLPIISKLAPLLSKRKVRILLSPDLSYTITLAIPSSVKTKEERAYIKNLVQDQIPELLESDDWDFKELESSKSEKKVLAFAPVSSFFNELSKVITATNLSVEAIEPEEVAKTRHNDPIIGIALKTDISGKDQNVLNVFPKQVSETDDADKKKPASSVAKRLVQTIIISIGILVIGFGSWLLFQNYQNNQSTPAENNVSPVPSEYNEPIVEPTAEQIATDASKLIIDQSDYSVLVLNGTGIPKESTYVQKKLSEAGFLSLKTGNADAYDYIDTEVQIKEEVPIEIVGKIQELLPEYSVIEGDMLQENSDYDLVIVVGTKIGS
jgi:hypothetical protein